MAYDILSDLRPRILCALLIISYSGLLFSARASTTNASFAVAEDISTEVGRAEYFVDIHAQPPFDSLIKAQTNLMVYGGVEAVEMDGNMYLLAVGSTEVRELTAATENTRRVHVARSAARAAIARMFGSSVELERVLRSTDERDGLATYLQEHSRHILGGLRPVGNWYSADKSVYYEAMVVKIDVPVKERKGE